jgi:glycine betaine/proline transport system substrate-binding protein
MKKIKLAISLFAATILVCGLVMPAQVQAARDNVIISEQNWTGSTVICQVMKYVLEKNLKVPVKVDQLSGAVTWVGMDKGDVDVFSDIWETAEAAGMKKYAEEKKTCGLTLSYPNAPQGWYIPKYVQEKYGIKTVEDLKGKESIFDIDGDGKGDIWVGPTSWKNNEIQRVRIRDYGLNFTPLGVEQWAWLATLKDAYKKKKPVIFYYWEPEWLFTQYDLVMIKEPPYDPAKWKYVEKHPEESKITCGMQPSNVYVGYGMKLKDRLPKVYQFYKNWHIPIGEVNNLITMVTDFPGHPKMSPSEAAKKWADEHPDIVNSWLKGIQ